MRSNLRSANLTGMARSKSAQQSRAELDIPIQIDPEYACFGMRPARSAIHRWGLYATEFIPAGRKVIEYTGERIARRETKRRAESTDLIYLFTLDSYWTIDGETSLRDLAAETGILEGSGRHIDREALKKVCASIPRGRWTTYGDLAAAIGAPGAAQSVAGILASDPTVENAHRVLRSGGRISPGWTTTDGSRGPEYARMLLEGEGVSFDEGGVADDNAYWKPPGVDQITAVDGGEPDP